ncbi:hypothetical protein Tco_0363706 [Tanacetum coccineum]
MSSVEVKLRYEVTEIKERWCQSFELAKGSVRQHLEYERGKNALICNIITRKVNRLKVTLKCPVFRGLPEIRSKRNALFSVLTAVDMSSEVIAEKKKISIPDSHQFVIVVSKDFGLGMLITSWSRIEIEDKKLVADLVLMKPVWVAYCFVLSYYHFVLSVSTSGEVRSVTAAYLEDCSARGARDDDSVLSSGDGSINWSTVSHPNGTEALITKVGNMKQTEHLTLYDVLVVPEYCVSIMPVHKVARDNKFIIAFDELHCYILPQDLREMKVLRIGKQKDSLYYFDGF